MAVSIGQKIFWRQDVNKKWHFVKGDYWACRQSLKFDKLGGDVILDHPMKPDGGMFCLDCLRELNR